MNNVSLFQVIPAKQITNQPKIDTFPQMCNKVELLLYWSYKKCSLQTPSRANIWMAFVQMEVMHQAQVVGSVEYGYLHSDSPHPSLLVGFTYLPLRGGSRIFETAKLDTFILIKLVKGFKLV